VTFPLSLSLSLSPSLAHENWSARFGCRVVRSRPLPSAQACLSPSVGARLLCCFGFQVVIVDVCAGNCRFWHNDVECDLGFFCSILTPAFCGCVCVFCFLCAVFFQSESGTATEPSETKMLKSLSNRLGGQLSPLSKFNTSPEIETVETPRRSAAVTKSEYPAIQIND
jgi:hypothetical protein